MSKLAKALTAAAGNAGGGNLYVEDVFSTYLYTGNGATGQSIVNGIDLSGKGGLVWGKSRDNNASHSLYDTERGTQTPISTNSINGNGDDSSGGATKGLYQFNSDGFTVGDDWAAAINLNNSSTVAWTFRKAEKFFDVVTYTGNGTTQSISHNLGSTPGVIIVKNTQSSTYWAVYHGSVPAYVGFLNATNAFNTSNTQNFGNNTNPVAPTDSVFTVGQQSLVNSDGETYVAYLFASDAGGFGDDGSESIIKCGSLTIASQATVEVDCGFETQFVLLKNSTSSGNWFLFDTMRGMAVTGFNWIFPNLSGAEEAKTYQAVYPTATGFGFNPANNGQFTDGNYIYIAIRRPMKTPESGTEVFAPVATTAATNTKITTDFAVDWQIIKDSRPGSNAPYAMTRLTGVSTVSTDQNGGYLRTNSTGEELVGSITRGWDNTGYKLAGPFGGNDSIYWNFKRATGFFDVVAYTGDGVNGRDVIHNLKVLPEFVIIKERNSSTYWLCWHKDINDYYLRLNDTHAAAAPSTFWDHSTYPVTSTSFPIGTHGFINGSGDSYIAYLFATLAGVSKVGSYTGNNLDTTIDCGFSNGARFVMIKRIDSTGDWTVFDTARGWSTSTDYWLDLNNTNAEEIGNTLTLRSAGFGVRASPYDAASLNVSGATYIYLAIA